MECDDLDGLAYVWGQGVDGVLDAFRGVLVGSDDLDGPAAGWDCSRVGGDFG